MDESGEMFDQYGISAFPTTFMIDRDGNVYGYVPGQMTEDIMRSVIEQTLNGGGFPAQNDKSLIVPVNK